MIYHYLQASMKRTTIESGSKTSLSLGEYDIRAISIPKKPSHSCKSQKLQQDPYLSYIVKRLSRKLPSQNLENADNRIYSCLQYIHHQTISTCFHLYNLALKWPMANYKVAEVQLLVWDLSPIEVQFQLHGLTWTQGSKSNWYKSNNIAKKLTESSRPRYKVQK